MAAGRFLRGSGMHASITPDDRVPGAYVLSIGGAEQSHVNLADPTEVFYEYLRRIANVVDLAGAPGQPLRSLHLGAGALTLARYIEATRPGSEQHAVELERELLDYVLERLPLPAGTDLQVHIGDARQELAFGELDGLFEVIVLDIFSGPEAPEHLTTPEFYGELMQALAQDGVLLVNVGDDPPLNLIKSQIRALSEATAPDAVAALGESGMFGARYPGNIVLAARHTPWPRAWTEVLLAAGPHPASVLSGVELEGFSKP